MSDPVSVDDDECPMGWNDLPTELRRQVWDSFRAMEDGCAAAVRLCRRPINKEHAQWCRDNAAWLRDWNVIKVRPDQKMIHVFNEFRYGYIDDFQRRVSQVDRDRLTLAKLATDGSQGFVSIPTTLWRAMNSPLVHHNTCSLLGLRLIEQDNTRRRHDDPGRLDGNAVWTTCQFLPGYRVYKRHFWDDPHGRGHGHGWMLYAERL